MRIDIELEKGGSASASLITRDIAIVLSEECDLLGVCTITEVLARANELCASASKRIRYETHHLSAKGGYVRCAHAITVSTQAFTEFPVHRPDHILLVCTAATNDRRDDPVQTAWLQRMRNRGAAIRSLSVDLDGSRMAGNPRQPDLRVRTNRDRVSPALRAAFDIMRLDLGDQVALEAMRLATGEEDLPSPLTGPKSPADKVRSAARWLRENCHRPLVISDVAHACALSERSLLRHFQMHLKMSPSEYLQRVRIELACEMLVHTSLPADKIARRVGLTSGDRLGKTLRRVTGMSPTEYRLATLERTPASVTASNNIHQGRQQ